MIKIYQQIKFYLKIKLINVGSEFHVLIVTLGAVDCHVEDPGPIGLSC